jgi:SAM-dependent methyltransferase
MGPAERADEALARFYDLDLEAEDPGDLGLYLSLAEQTGGPILELAVGSGRVAIPLVEAGHEVVGVDLDPAMLERARAAAAAAGIATRLTLVEGDLLEARIPGAGRFRLGILALNSLFLLARREAQAAAIRVLADALAPGGLAVVDVWIPTARDLAGYDGRLLLAGVHADGATGRTVTKSWSATHDATTAGVILTTIYEEGLPGEPSRRWVRRDAMRLVTTDELRGFAEAAGLVVEGLAGGYDLEPIAPGAERAILLARRPEGTAGTPGSVLLHEEARPRVG